MWRTSWQMRPRLCGVAIGCRFWAIFAWRRNDVPHPPEVSGSHILIKLRVHEFTIPLIWGIWPRKVGPSWLLFSYLGPINWQSLLIQALAKFRKFNTFLKFSICHATRFRCNFGRKMREVCFLSWLNSGLRIRGWVPHKFVISNLPQNTLKQEHNGWKLKWSSSPCSVVASSHRCGGGVWSSLTVEVDAHTLGNENLRRAWKDVLGEEGRTWNYQGAACWISGIFVKRISLRKGCRNRSIPWVDILQSPWFVTILDLLQHINIIGKQLGSTKK